MEARQVEAGQGWQWIAQGFALFRKNPLIWLALLLVYIVIVFALSVVPIVGGLIVALLSPVFAAGFLMGCKALEKDEELELAHLFAGFKTNTSQLVTVGGLYLVGYILIIGLVMMLGGGSLLGMLVLGQQPDPALMAGAMGGMMIAMLIGLALLVPLLMAYWFAPALVVFHDVAPVEAMKLSFAACWRNMLAFTIYGLLTFVLAVLAAIPFGLGLFVLVPTLTATLYTSYKDIFAVEAE